MKALITNQIYLDNLGEQETVNIKKALTYKIKIGTNSTFMRVETIRNYKQLTKTILAIPQTRTDLIPDSYNIVDKRILNPVPFPTPRSDLRPDQKAVVDNIQDNCFINALVGWGKTYAALHLARKLGQKTLVVVHNTALRDQWSEEIESLYGMEAGVIGSGKFDIDHPIVVGNIQSLVKYADKINKEFGTIVVDEAHHTPATTFTNFVSKMQSRYKIALSGTMVRKDNKHVLFKDYFGDQVFSPEKFNTLDPKVRVIKSTFSLNADLAWTDRVTELLGKDDYQDFISALAKAQMHIGHQVLIVADRVEFLQQVREKIGDSCVLVTGDTSFEQRQEIKQQLLSLEKMAVAGSRQIFSEGISINSLSCVILAVPVNNDALLEQIIGRIMRNFPDKMYPEVLDINFQGRNDRRQNSSRMGLYLRKGWQIETM